MISKEEVERISNELNVPISYVEKDYVMGWILNSIYSNENLKTKLVLKGGNCLRKIYFEDTRFSDDLDFTMCVNIPADNFKTYLYEICEDLKERVGIDFQLNETKVKEKEFVTPSNNSFNVLDGRIYFKGFAGDSSISMKIKFDVSEYEKIILPLQWHDLIHKFSDNDLCITKIYCYSIEEVLAEKLRAWIQRTRPRDLYDVVKIIYSKKIPFSKINILNTFLQKTIYKNIPVAGKEELLFENKFKDVEKSWLETVIVCSKNAWVIFNEAVSLFKEFISSLFSEKNFENLKTSLGNIRDYYYNVRSGIRETIIEAGKTNKILRIKYSGKERNIEPYSFRYGRGMEYFYGFDLTNGHTIKSFILNKIESVSILPDDYNPKWEVEF